MVRVGGASLKFLGTLLLVSVTCLCGPGFASALPDGRVYEMVSPPYKAGYQVNEVLGVVGNEGSVMSGSSGKVIYTSTGGFAGLLGNTGLGVAYMASRGAGGWSTVAEQSPFGTVVDVSADMEYVLANSTVGANSGQATYSGTEDELLVHLTSAPETDENWGVLGVPMKQLNGLPTEVLAEGASANLCHVVVGFTEALLPAAVNSVGQIYDVGRGCGDGKPSLQALGVNNEGTEGVPINRNCPVELGVGGGYSSNHEVQEDTVNAISSDGSEIFFTTNVETGNKCASGILQLFVRLGGSRTVEVSKPVSLTCSEVPCEKPAKRASAYFDGASRDGSRVFFTTSAPLTKEGQGNDIYMARVGCPGESSGCDPAERVVTSLVQVSHNLVPDGADVQGVTRVSPDGSHVYFVASSVLTGEANAEGENAVSGADNLYVYDSVTGKLTFVAELCSGPGKSGGSGPELSGAVEDVSCPTDLERGGKHNDRELWRGAFPEAQSSGSDGRFLVFSTYAQLVREDTDDAKDIYRYDVETGNLERVSVGEDSYKANGNANGSDNDAKIAASHMGGRDLADQQYELGSRAISDEGTKIVFSSAGALSPRATNNLTDFYEWSERSGVSLISSGSAEEADENAVITPSGEDVFFKTVQELAPQDTDAVFDIYDARVDGGFPAVPAERRPCEGDACQGALTNPAPLLVPGSVLQSAGENLAPPKKAVKKKKTKKKSKPKGKAKARHAAHRSSAVKRGKRA
jgi:hypothetical protein